MTDWLFDTLLATSALLLLVLLIRGPVARHFGPSVAYWLWLFPPRGCSCLALTKEVGAFLPRQAICRCRPACYDHAIDGRIPSRH